ncbi:MAG: deoxyhypusine synthase [Methanobacteriota archaeon]|nr:MAG: deoxyhypusine synthase [Euryarchaeota archaeon]
MERRRFLDRPTRPISVGEKSVGRLLEEMGGLGFQGRNLSLSVDIWAEMLRERGLSIFLGLSGAMVPAGMGRVISFLIENRMVDCLVTTGANLFHDAHEALGGRHYIGSEGMDDRELFKCEIDRIHDILASEREFRELDRRIAGFAERLGGGPYSSREFIYLLGEHIAGLGGLENSILVSAYRHGVPVFSPSISDSSIGIGLALARRKGHPVQLDHVKDVEEITSIVEASEKTGVVYVGGGVPKNFIQQTEIVASLFGSENMGHEYAIQYTTDSPQWGGLSGCTFDEAVSWGKISAGARKVQVFVDATIALPIVSHALWERTRGYIGKRRHPRFELSGPDFKVSF